MSLEYRFPLALRNAATALSCSIRKPSSRTLDARKPSYTAAGDLAGMGRGWVVPWTEHYASDLSASILVAALDHAPGKQLPRH